MITAIRIRAEEHTAMTNPYREPSEKPEEPEKGWWEDEKPTEKERELWVTFYLAFMRDPEPWKAKSPTQFADNAMKTHRRRFGVVK
jgi:hypothetical protein